MCRPEFHNVKQSFLPVNQPAPFLIYRSCDFSRANERGNKRQIRRMNWNPSTVLGMKRASGLSQAVIGDIDLPGELIVK
jgi:hypothetical protein